MPTATKPKLTNRGPAGLHTNLKKSGGTLVPAAVPEKAMATQAVAVNRISSGLRPLAQPITSVVPDPNNARVHGDRNMDSIVLSLQTYGQVKPIVVRKATRVVVAGNGTLEAALKLGWTEIAVNEVDFNDVEATGYGLADNRTAELAKWNFEIVARLDKLLQESGHPSIGWSDDELQVLRAAEWVPPPVDESASFEVNKPAEEQQGLVVDFTPEQNNILHDTVAQMRVATGNTQLTPVEAVKLVIENPLAAAFSTEEKNSIDQAIERWRQIVAEAGEVRVDTDSEVIADICRLWLESLPPGL